MTLRGAIPNKAQKRMKALWYGEPGAGKTTAAIQFPRPYLIDTEKGAVNDAYVDLLRERQGAVFASNNWEDIVAESRALLEQQHAFATLIIDPITTIYDDALDRAEEEVGSEWGRHHGRAKKDWKRLGRLLSRLDMNVIVTAHSKKLLSDSGKLIGLTYDGPKGLDYLFDLVFEVQRRGPRERVAFIRKSRHANFVEGDSFPFSYEEIANRYGREVLERDSGKIELASAEQLREFDALLKGRQDAKTLLAKWLQNDEASSADEMTAANLAKRIEWLRSKQGAPEATQPLELPEDIGNKPTIVAVGQFDSALARAKLHKAGDLIANLEESFGHGWASSPWDDIRAKCHEYRDACAQRKQAS